MKTCWSVSIVVGLLMLAVGFGLGTVVGQQSPPTKNKGLGFTQ